MSELLMPPLPPGPAVEWARLPHACKARWRDAVGIVPEPERKIWHLDSRSHELADVCAWLFSELRYAFASLIVEEDQASRVWSLAYIFYDDAGGGWAMVHLRQPLADMTVPSISERVHAADWHERGSGGPVWTDLRGSSEARRVRPARGMAGRRQSDA